MCNFSHGRAKTWRRHKLLLRVSTPCLIPTGEGRDNGFPNKFSPRGYILNTTNPEAFLVRSTSEKPRNSSAARDLIRDERGRNETIWTMKREELADKNPNARASSGRFFYRPIWNRDADKLQRSVCDFTHRNKPKNKPDSLTAFHVFVCTADLYRWLRTRTNTPCSVSFLSMSHPNQKVSGRVFITDISNGAVSDVTFRHRPSFYCSLDAGTRRGSFCFCQIIATSNSLVLTGKDSRTFVLTNWIRCKRQGCTWRSDTWKSVLRLLLALFN